VQPAQHIDPGEACDQFGLSREIADMLRAFRGFSSARLLVQGLVLPDRPVLGDVTDSNVSFGEGEALRRVNESMAALSFG